MADLQARPVDPRDVEREVDAPTYRVVFWEQGPPAPVGDAPGMWCSSEYDVAGAGDVEEVIAWARGRAAEAQTFTIHALVDRTALRLWGADPTRSS